jgi:hypothetical protein
MAALVQRDEKLPTTLGEWRSDLTSRITSAAFALNDDDRADLFESLRHILNSVQRDLAGRNAPPREGGAR